MTEENKDNSENTNEIINEIKTIPKIVKLFLPEDEIIEKLEILEPKKYKKYNK
jgi:hypothetical protein